MRANHQVGVKNAIRNYASLPGGGATFCFVKPNGFETREVVRKYRHVLTPPRYLVGILTFRYTKNHPALRVEPISVDFRKKI